MRKALWSLFITFAMAVFFSTSVQARAEGLISWLLEQVDAIQETQHVAEEIDPMMWMYERGTQAQEKDVREIAQILEEMDLGSVDEAFIIQMERDLKEELMRDFFVTREMLALRFLYHIGCGEYDEAFNWLPSSDAVFALDTELFGGEILYGDFFKGLNAICDGDLVFSDIDEDYRDANIEEGTGTIHISFLMNGESYTCDVQMMYDWFDVSMFNAVSKITAEKSGERRIYAMYDGMQGLIFVYQTSDWVNEFIERTGCFLSDSL